MPDFLDLPPELVEQIYLEYEASIHAQRSCVHDMEGVAETLGQLRLVCRHIEQSTRKIFVKDWFEGWMIKRPDDESIQRFCDMAKTPDLAASLTSLSILCDDDASMQVQETQSYRLSSIQDFIWKIAQALGILTGYLKAEAPSPPGPEATHVFDNVIGAMVPVAYLKNMDALVKALRACENISELWFGNVALDPKRMHLYRRVKPQAGNSDEDDDHGHGNSIGHAHDSTAIVFDITSTFEYFLSLAETAGVRPKQIATFSICSDNHINLGLTGCAGLAKSGAASEKLETLHLDIVQDRRETGAELEEVGSQLGQQLSQWYAKMPALKVLDLDFEVRNDSHERSSIATWKALAQTPAIPTLKSLCISQGTCAIDLLDFTGFIAKHVSSLQDLDIPHMHLYNGSLEDLGQLYDTLSQAPNMQSLHQSTLYLSDNLVEFPAQICCPITGTLVDEEDEEYLWVEQTNTIKWNGHDEVTEVMATMASHLRAE